MSLFIGGLAFEDPALGSAVKIGVLAGSILSAIAGYLLLLFAPEPPRQSFKPTRGASQNMPA
jgi:NhaA family Na+:H+ antiporter